MNKRGFTIIESLISILLLTIIVAAGMVIYFNANAFLSSAMRKKISTELASSEVEILKQADMIIGFNVRDFDMEVLAPYLLTPVKNFPILDLLVEFEKVRGHRISLQSVAQATLKSSKSGSGWDALQLFKDGKMEELKKYCFDDVRITREVYEYGLKHGKILFISNRDYQTHEVPITWANAFEEQKEKKKAESIFPTSLF